MHAKWLITKNDMWQKVQVWCTRFLFNTKGWAIAIFRSHMALTSTLRCESRVLHARGRANCLWHHAAWPCNSCFGFRSRSESDPSCACYCSRCLYAIVNLLTPVIFVITEQLRLNPTNNEMQWLVKVSLFTVAASGARVLTDDSTETLAFGRFLITRTIYDGCRMLIPLYCRSIQKKASTALQLRWANRVSVLICVHHLHK